MDSQLHKCRSIRGLAPADVSMDGNTNRLLPPADLRTHTCRYLDLNGQQRQTYRGCHTHEHTHTTHTPPTGGGVRTALIGDYTGVRSALCILTCMNWPRVSSSCSSGMPTRNSAIKYGTRNTPPPCL
eukprot:8795611-Pyramimonas_sp.AAC.1